MKKFVIISSTILFLASCEFLTESEPVSYKNYVVGHAQFVNPLTGVTFSKMDKTEFILRRSDSGSLPETFTDSLTGNEFKFGPLAPDTYIISATYIDQANGITYRGELPVDLTEKTNDAQLETLVVSVMPNSESGLSRISIQYTDVFSGFVNKNQPGITTTVVRKDGLSIDGQFQVVKGGSSFVLNKLNAGEKYLLFSSYEDATLGVNYSKIDSLVVTTPEVLLLKTITLDWLKTPTAIVTVLDEFDMPVQGVEIFTYTNPNFLNEYKDNAEASVREGVTNAKGQVIFTNLEEIKYYFYGIKKIGTDTLRTSNTLPVAGSAIIKDINPFTITLQP